MAAVGAVGMLENKCLATPLLPVINAILKWKNQIASRIPCTVSSLTLPQKRMPFANDI